MYDLQCIVQFSSPSKTPQYRCIYCHLSMHFHLSGHPFLHAFLARFAVNSAPARESRGTAPKKPPLIRKQKTPQEPHDNDTTVYSEDSRAAHAQHVWSSDGPAGSSHLCIDARCRPHAAHKRHQHHQPGVQQTADRGLTCAAQTETSTTPSCYWCRVQLYTSHKRLPISGRTKRSTTPRLPSPRKQSKMRSSGR